MEPSPQPQSEDAVVVPDTTIDVPASKQLVSDARDTIARTHLPRRDVSWWISFAAALIALTSLVVVFAASVIVNSLRHQVEDLTAINKESRALLADSRTETGCRAQKAADLAFARGVLDTKTAVYNIDFNGLVQALLAKNDVDTAHFSQALNDDSVALDSQRTEVDRLSALQKTAVQDCALSPIDVSDSQTATTQP